MKQIFLTLFIATLTIVSCSMATNKKDKSKDETVNHYPEYGHIKKSLEQVRGDSEFISATLQQYGNLKSREDWHKLFGDLVHMHAFANRIWLQKVNPVTFRQLVRMTSLLFQAITPIRFAFVDGQSRMTGACHLLRNTMPEKSLIATQRRILKRAPGKTDFHLPDNSMIAPFGTMSSTNLV